MTDVSQDHGQQSAPSLTTPPRGSVGRVALALVAVSLTLGAVLVHRLGLVLDYWTPASFSVIARLSVFLAFLFAVWWRVPWIATASILGLLFVLSGGAVDPISPPALASVAIALITGTMLNRLEKAHAAAAVAEPDAEITIEDGLRSISWLMPAGCSHGDLQSEIDRLSDLNRELVSRNDELQQFTSIASHDLKSPLRAIHGFGQALLDEYSPVLEENAAHYVQRMQAAALRLEKTVDALLELARVGHAGLGGEDVDVARIVREAVSELAAREPSRAVELSVPDSLIVRGDPDLLRIALANIVTNAWKFTRPRPCARVEVARVTTSRGPAVCIRDNGVGFDPAHAESMFRPFERLHSAHEFEGSGIGLATVERIVTRHGGSVWAEGSPGSGAAVFLQLPEAS